MAKSFISRVSPSRSRSKVIDWPFPSENEDAPKVRLSVLSADKLEAANLEAVDHFTKLFEKSKKKVDTKGDAFLARERTALVFYAFEVKDEREDWVPIADSVDELALESSEVITALFREWNDFQAEVTTRPMTSKQMDMFIAELKKNTQEVPLDALPSSWLIALVRTLANPPAPLTLAKGVG